MNSIRNLTNEELEAVAGGDGGPIAPMPTEPPPMPPVTEDDLPGLDTGGS